MKLVGVGFGLLTGQSHHKRTLEFDQQGGSEYGSTGHLEWHHSGGSSSNEQLHFVAVELWWVGGVVGNQAGRGGAGNTGDAYGIVELAEAGAGAVELLDGGFVVAVVVVVVGDYQQVTMVGVVQLGADV